MSLLLIPKLTPPVEPAPIGLDGASGAPSEADEYIEYTCDHFVNALGIEADKFARKLDIQSGLYPVKHQAFITRRMPNLGVNNIPLPMIIDRRNYKGFSAVYGQQLAETGQIIGCASPANDPRESGKNQRVNSRDFIEIVSILRVLEI